MKVIKVLSEKIEEEISDAKAYVTLALEYKSEYPELSKTLFTLSTQEMDHMQMLHASVTDLIKKYRDKNGEPPADMMAVYDYLHKRQIEKATEVKTMQTMYKES